MAELLEIVFVVFVAIIVLSLVIIAGVLVIKYLEHRKKSVDYVQEGYLDLIQFTKQSCPDNIYGYFLERAVTKTSEGRKLGTILGHAELAIELKETTVKKKSKDSKEVKKTKIIEVIKRHFITYRPVEFDFNILNPRSWRPQLRIAVIEDSELPEGLNGNVRWEAESTDWYKYYVYSISDAKLSRSVLATKISDDVKLDFGIKAWEEVGAIASRAADTDPALIKGIKSVSEFKPRGKQL